MEPFATSGVHRNPSLPPLPDSQWGSSYPCFKRRPDVKSLEGQVQHSIWGAQAQEHGSDMTHINPASDLLMTDELCCAHS